MQLIPMPLTIETATTPAQYAAGKAIFTAYAGFLGMDLEFQGFAKEMATLDVMYGPPTGCLLLAKLGDEYIGAVGLREHEPDVAEMKRMFVLTRQQGTGAGKALMDAFIDKAKELGYRSIKLDSIKSLDKALMLYRKYGFREIGPYRYNPHPEAVFMELELS